LICESGAHPHPEEACAGKIVRTNEAEGAVFVTGGHGGQAGGHRCHPRDRRGEASQDLADYLAELGMLMECYRHPAAQPNLVFITHDVALDWMDPAPACFVYPHAKIWRLIKSWLANPNGSRFNRWNIMLEGIYRPGPLEIVK
jgi:hypothetical protein